jgi:hypothetical protein
VLRHKRELNVMQATKSPAANPHQTPVAPSRSPNAKPAPTGNPTSQYDANPITAGTRASCSPRSIAADTT